MIYINFIMNYLSFLILYINQGYIFGFFINNSDIRDYRPVWNPFYSRAHKKISYLLHTNCQSFKSYLSNFPIEPFWFTYVVHLQFRFSCNNYDGVVIMVTASISLEREKAAINVHWRYWTGFKTVTMTYRGYKRVPHRQLLIPLGTLMPSLLR